MVFVHARKETVNAAKKLKEQAIEEGMSTFFEPTDHPKCGIYRRDISMSRNKEMKELFDAGFGIHHAGMLRSDRNMMERMFEDQAIKVRVPVDRRVKLMGRFFAVLLHWLGVLICPHMLSLLRVPRCTIAPRVLSSIFPYWMFYK
jgi:hypothetical protein